jgi:D-lactate dehydrogenase (cytochrome)
LTDPDILKSYGSSDNSYHPSSPHSVVVKAGSTEDVVKIVKIAYDYRIPLVVYSGATSLEGHFSGVTSRVRSPRFINYPIAPLWKHMY